MTVLSRSIAATRSMGPVQTGPFTITIGSGFNLDLRTLALNAGWNGTSAVVANVVGNIGSNSAGTAALTVAGTFPGGVSLTIASGVYIAGKGGDSNNANNGSNAGGTALSVSTAVNITNNGTIGGGGGAGSFNYNQANGYGGAGAGLQPGYQPPGNYTAATLTTGGSAANTVGGAIGQQGANASNQIQGGGGGGLGAAGGQSDGYYDTGHTDANVGDSDPTGSSGGSSGGAAGRAISGNRNITWITTGLRYGPIDQ